MTIYLPKGTLITLDAVEISEHNRAPIAVDYEPIQLGDRTLGGYLRKQYIGKKAQINVSWENLPALDTATVDGYAGRNSIKGIVDQFWGTTANSLVVTYKEVDANNAQSYIVLDMYIDSYNESLVKRWDSQLWNINLTLVEV